MRILSYGAGVDSTAILVGLMQRNEDVDLITFGDTGGEHPETYAYLDTMDEWLEEHCYPTITRVRKFGAEKGEIFEGSIVTHKPHSRPSAYGPGYTTLEGLNLQNQTLPSPAYGQHTCTETFKITPQRTYVKDRWPDEHVEWLIGFDATETRRTKKFGSYADDKNSYTFPLIEWDWDRERCKAEIAAAGLPVPMKSSCWFCPYMKKHEVKALAINHPDLFARGLELEDNWKTGRHYKEGISIKGLGRGWNWRSWAEEEGLVSIEAAA